APNSAAPKSTTPNAAPNSTTPSTPDGEDDGLATVIPFVQQLLGTDDPKAITQLLLGQGQDVSAQVLKAMLTVVYGLFGGKLPVG
ncbi:cell wall hydrolase, partial [Gordonia sp. DT218]